MALAVLLFFLLKDVGEKALIATVVPIWISAFIIILFEYLIPFNLEWKPSIKDFVTDGIFIVVIQALVPQFLIWVTAIGILYFSNGNGFSISSIWPHDWPLWVQIIMLVYLSDFLRYWLHRGFHTIPLLWRLHAVHHSLKKLYWLNTSHFHPIEKALQFTLDVLPFMILGVSQEIIALHLVLYGVNGFFQHCNIDLKYGWLSYIVSSTDHHRWHHSKIIEESNSNYGNNVCLWDILFGSFFLPKEGSVKKLGLINESYPTSFSQQLFSPFVKNLDKEPKS